MDLFVTFFYSLTVTIHATSSTLDHFIKGNLDLLSCVVATHVQFRINYPLLPLERELCFASTPLMFVSLMTAVALHDIELCAV